MNDKNPSPTKSVPASPDDQVRPTPLLIIVGVLAVVVGIGAGLVMSQATLFR